MLGKFGSSLGWAVQGIVYALKNERHMQFHLAATLMVLLVGWVLTLTPTQWLMVAFAITLVWVTELLNTAIETVVDLYTSHYHPLAKIAKDVAAGAVLVAAINALVVAMVIFLPKLAKLLQ